MTISLGVEAAGGVRAGGVPSPRSGFLGMRVTFSRRIVASGVCAALVALVGVASRGREPTAEPFLRDGRAGPTGATLGARSALVPLPHLWPRTTGSLARMAAALPFTPPAPRPANGPALLQPERQTAPTVTLPAAPALPDQPSTADGASATPPRAPAPASGAAARPRRIDRAVRAVQFVKPAAEPAAGAPAPLPLPGTVAEPVEGTPRRGPVAAWINGARGGRDGVASAPVPAPLAVGSRLGERLRAAERNLSDRLAALRGSTAAEPPVSDGLAEPGGWPRPVALHAQLALVREEAAAPVAEWVDDTRSALDLVAATAGPADALAAEPLALLGEAPAAGLRVADTLSDPTRAAALRRAALAVSRRATVWRAAALVRQATGLAPGEAERCEAETERLLDALERFEATQSPVDGQTASLALATLAGLSHDEPRRLAAAARDHYVAANLRVAVHRSLVERLLPDAEVDRGVVDDTILGRQVRGRRTVERTTGLRFVPDPDELSFDIEVRGHVESQTVTESGPVALSSRGVSAFTVHKPVKLSSTGLLFGAAHGIASNRSQLAGIETSFDSVPLMRGLVRTMARNQHDDNLPEANREVVDKIVSQACREVDRKAEQQFVEASQRIRGKVWTPLVKLGLEPTPVGMETTADLATLRLRLAAAGQLAAHTPRPRGPDDALFALQLHESALNNAFDRFGLAGRRLALEDLFRLLAEKVGREPQLPDDLPEGVTVAFAASQPLRVGFRDGLVHLRMALDAIESGRRDWYDVVVQVAYRPRAGSMQVFLDREGPVQLSGPGHQGRIEIALRTIFGKVFPKERPIALVPPQVQDHPKLAGMPVAHLAVTDGWLAFALAAPPAAAPAPATAAAPQAADKPTRRLLVR